jgi:hypothetical protein
MSDDDTDFKIEGLDKLLKALKSPSASIRVGILGKGGARSAGKQTNAGIGRVHEFGLGHCPKRSFLREPLADNLKNEMESAGAFDKDTLKEVVSKGTMLAWCQKVAVLAEGIVLKAFDSNGYGKWAALKPSTLAHKKNAQTLVETGQLRNSITSEVKAK